MKKFTIEIKWAFIFATMTLLWMIMERLVGLHSVHIDKHPIYTNFIAIPAIAIYITALLEKRRKFYNGIMTFKQGFVSGLIITAIVTLISPLTQIITAYIISPEYFPNVIKYSVEHNLMTQNAAENYFKLSSYILQGLIGAPIMGIVTSALAAFFARKRMN